MLRQAEQPELDAADWLDGEHLTVWRRRYREARDAGLDQHDAACFADSTADIGQLLTRDSSRAICFP